MRTRKREDLRNCFRTKQIESRYRKTINKWRKHSMCKTLKRLIGAMGIDMGIVARMRILE